MRLLLILCALLLAPALARAQTCSLSVTAMNFGAADLLPGTPVDTTASLTATCTGMPAGPSTYYCLSFGPGGGGSSGSNRLMNGPGSAKLNYTFYVDGGHAYAWGSRSYPALGTSFGQASTTATMTSTGTIYGRIAAAQSTTATGSYSSTFSGANDVSLFTLVSPSTDCNGGPIASSPRATATFTVSAAPAPHCVVSTTNLNFGSQGVLTTNIDSTGSVSVQCTSSLSYTVGLNNGISGTGPTNRFMTSGANTARYAIYRDSSRTLAWGNIAGQMATGTGTGLAQAYTVYGRVPPQTTPAAGSYSDTVNVTVTY